MRDIRNKMIRKTWTIPSRISQYSWDNCCVIYYIQCGSYSNRNVCQTQRRMQLEMGRVGMD